MSFELRNLLLATACGAAFVSLAFLAPSRRPPHVAKESSSARPAPAPSAAAAPKATREDLTTPLGKPLPELSKFVFDCSGFPAAAKPRCAAPPPDEAALLDFANTYRPAVAPTYPPAFADQVDAALRAGERIDSVSLSPLRRAALQNAALWVFSQCSSFKDEPRARAAARAARALVKRFHISKAELAKLPKAAEVLAEWLGKPSDWTRGNSPRSFHTAADAFTRTHHQLVAAPAFADVVRMVLLDETESPVISDVVQRLALRRTAGKTVQICLAELDPTSETCSMPGALRALDATRGDQIAIHPLLPPACQNCHVDNTPRSKFGAGTGFAFDDLKTEARVKDILGQALRAPR